MTKRDEENKVAIVRITNHIQSQETLILWHESQAEMYAKRIDFLEKENSQLKQHIKNFEAEKAA